MSSSDNNEQQQQNNNKTPQQNIAQGFTTPTEQNPNPTNNITNPISTEDIQKKIDEENNKKQYNKIREEQMAVKFRTEMQNAEYTPPKGMENDPLLQPTKKNVVASTSLSAEQQPNANLGEQVIQVPDSENQQQPTEQVKKANTVQVDQSKQLKG